MSTLDFTEEEIDKIRQLRTRVGADLSTKFQNENAFLITWLRARNMNVDQAEVMLRKSLEWRKENKVDGILEREQLLIEKCKLHFPFAYLGMEPETGCPIFLLLTGRYDIRSVVEDEGMGLAYTRKCNTIFIELVQTQMKENAKKVGRPVTAAIQLIDMEGLSLRQMGTRKCRQAVQEIQLSSDANCPEAVKSAILVNAPNIFSFIFNMMKPFIAQATMDKVEIWGTDEVKWKEAVSKKIPMELLPKHWGGTLDGDDEYCSTSDIWSCPLDPSFFSNDAVEAGFTKTEIKARDKFHLEFNVEQSDVLLEWKFRTDCHDIGFAVYRNGTDEMIPPKRVDSHKEAQEGTHKCEITGTYKLVFDNSYSYTRSKTLYHKVQMVAAEETVSLNDIEGDITNQ